MNGYEELLTAKEAADELRVDDATLRRWVKWGIVEAVILPRGQMRGGFRFKRSTLDAMKNNMYEVQPK